jgi:hypothetical protein
MSGLVFLDLFGSLSEHHLRKKKMYRNSCFQAVFYMCVRSEIVAV